MTLHSLMCFRSKCKCMQKTFPYAYVNSLMEWPRLASYLHVMLESHYYSESFACYLSSQSTHFLCLIYLLLKMTPSNLHIFIHVLPKNHSAQAEHIWGWETGKEKATGCSCEERSEPIVWMFLNYIHFLFVRVLPIWLTTEHWAWRSCNIHCLCCEGQLIVSLKSCV